MTLSSKLARLCAVVLLLLAASPFTAPFAVCDISAHGQTHDKATHTLNHAGALVRTAAARDVRTAAVCTHDVGPCVAEYRMPAGRTARIARRSDRDRYRILRL